jgi:hypothetical protein
LGQFRYDFIGLGVEEGIVFIILAKEVFFDFRLPEMQKEKSRKTECSRTKFSISITIIVYFFLFTEPEQF